MSPPPRQRISVDLRTDLRERLFREADARVVSVSYLVARAVEDFLDRLPPLP